MLIRAILVLLALGDLALTLALRRIKNNWRAESATWLAPTGCVKTSLAGDTPSMNLTATQQAIANKSVTIDAHVFH
jgi:hypothetical protein